MADKRTKILRALVWPFFQLIGVIAVLLVGVSVYTLYLQIQTDSSTAGFPIISSVDRINSPPPSFELRASQGTLSGMIQLDWETVPGAKEYNVYRTSAPNAIPCMSGEWISRMKAGENPAFLDPAKPGERTNYQVEVVYSDGRTICSRSAQGFAK